MKAPYLALILVVLVFGLSAVNQRFNVIENFESGSVLLTSYMDEDVQPDSWSLTTTDTYNNSQYSLQLSGNTWKRQSITPIILDTTTVFQIAAKTSSGAKVQGIGFSDGTHTLFYSLAGTLTLDIEIWIPVYQGTQSTGNWATYNFPVADDWRAFFDDLSTITSVIYINDLDGVSSRSVWFDDVLDVSSDLPIAPQVTISYSLVTNTQNADRLVGVQFTSTINDPDSQEWTYQWDFGDSTYSNLANPYKVYSIEDAHPYRSTLKVLDDAGKWGYASCMVNVDVGVSSLPIRMNFVGDVMLARRYDQAGGIIPTLGVNAIFEPTLNILGGAADITCANLEVALTNQGTPHPTKSVVYRGNPANVTGLVYAGIDIVSTANNHTMDYMLPGLLQTQDVLNQHGIIHSGSGITSYEAYTPAFVNKRGLNIAFLRSCDRTGQYNNAQPFLQSGFDKPGFAYMTPYYISRQLAAVDGIADLKIVEMHGGSEYSTSPGEGYDKSNPFLEDTQDEDYSLRSDVPHQWDIEIRQGAIDAGADLVIVHHPHIIQALEVYNGKLIAHSLGNFIFDLDYPECMPSMILYADADQNGFSNFSVAPVFIDNFIPEEAIGQLGTHILDYLAMKSRERNSILVVNKNTNRAHVVLDPADVTPVQHNNNLQVYVYPISEEISQTSPFKLPRHGSISSVQGIDPIDDAQMRLGAETLWFGNFEDEGSTQWDIPAYSTTDVVDGARSALLAPTTNGQTMTATTINRFKMYDNTKKYTLHGWIKTRNAANANIQIRYYNSRTYGSPISTENVCPGIEGITDWTYYYKELSVPPNCYYYQIRLTVTNPSGQTTQALFDNVGLIQWTDWSDILAQIPYPNNYYYMQIMTGYRPKSLSVSFIETDYWFNPPRSKPGKITSPIKNLKSYPNPFNAEANISFQSEQPAQVKLEIYNLRGQLVRGLADALLPAGSHHFVWNGIDNNNRAVGSGIYFIKVQSGGRSTIRKTIMMK